MPFDSVMDYNGMLKTSVTVELEAKASANDIYNWIQNCNNPKVLRYLSAVALNAAKHGAKHVTAVDISADAIELTRRNAELNGLSESMSFVCKDVFDLLTELERRKKCEYDYIILDPPAFTKSRETVSNAIKGYKAINAKAMKLLPRGGYLATCSCSHFMTDELFRRMLHDAAEDAGVQLRQIEGRQQAPDHPILWNVPETDYLKFYIFQIV